MKKKIKDKKNKRYQTKETQLKGKETKKECLKPINY